MLTNTFNSTLRVAYPAAVFLAVIASGGMRWVQAEGFNFHLFQNNKYNQYDISLTSAEAKTCSQTGRNKLIDHPLTCHDEYDVERINQTNENQQYVNNDVRKHEKTQARF